jgi:hypothetical protein
VNVGWFSAAVRFRTAVDGQLAHDSRSVFVFQAGDWESARQRALELGRQAEEGYRNGAGEPVEKRLVRVETLDLLGDELVDGREVWWETLPVEKESFRTPEDAEPSQTGV